MRFKPDRPNLDDPSIYSLPAWDKFVPVAASVLMLALICLFLSSIMAHLGAFPTLFLAAVAVVTVVMQLGELTTPHHPQL